MAEAGKLARAGTRTKAAGKAAAQGDPKVLGQVARILLRAIWVQQWQASHPDAKPEDRKAAWDDIRETLMSKNLQTYRKALAALAKSGVVIALPDGEGFLAAQDEGED